MKKIIVFTGKKQTGKDTSADAISKKMKGLGISSKKLAFADSLKQFCMNALGLTYKQCYGTDADKETETNWLWENIDIDIREKYSDRLDIKRNLWRKGHTPAFFEESFEDFLIKGPMTARNILQVYGTDIMRDKFDKDVWTKVAMNMAKSSEEDCIIFTDARFPNEIEAAQKEKAIIIRLERTNYPFKDEHPSETALDDYNFDNCYKVRIESGKTDLLISHVHNIMKEEGIYENKENLSK